MTIPTGEIPARMDGIGRTENRGATRLDTVWLIRPPLPRWPSVGVLMPDAQSTVEAAADHPALVILSDTVPAVAETARAVIHAGGRVYGLAPDGWGGGDLPDWVVDAPSTGLLVRRIRDAPVAAVLSGDQGWLWLGPAGPGRWRLTLEPDQVAAARLVFQQLYWIHADDEAWPADSQLRWRARGDAPFDVPKAPAHAAVRLAQGRLPLPADATRVVYSPGSDLPNTQTARLWVPPSSDGHAQLVEAVRAGTDVVWADLGLPPCATGDNSVMVPSNARWSLRIALSPRQATALTQVLGQEPDATFRTDVELSAARAWLGETGHAWLPGQAQPDMLTDEQELDAGVVPATSLRDMPITEPSTWPAPGPLALTARWTWQVRPPQVPKGAADDLLVERWRELDTRYAARVEYATATLTKIEAKEGMLERTFAALASPLLGFRRSRSTLRTALAECATTSPSTAGPVGARALMARLGDIEAEVTRLVDEMAEAERKAREAEERKRQQREHAKAQEKAREALEVNSKEIEEKQQRLAELDTKMGELASDTAMSKKDRRAARNKLNDERNRLDKQIQSLEHTIERDTATVNQPFQFRPSVPPASGVKSGGSFVPPASNCVDGKIPDEALPAIGRLLRAGQDRLLAISQWEELDQGEAEADRLGARLVTRREDT